MRFNERDLSTNLHHRLLLLSCLCDCALSRLSHVSHVYHTARLSVSHVSRP
jgi:hypothetical protein